MNARTMNARTLPVALLSLLALACGGAEGSLVESDTSADTAGDTSDDTAGDTSEDTTPVVRSLDCPNPGTLPFVTEATAFANPDSAGIFADNPEEKTRNLDFLGKPGDPQTITGIMARGAQLFSTVLTGEPLSLWYFDETAGWTQLGRTTTDANGAYSFSGFPAFPQGTHKTYAVLEGAQTCFVHGVFVWPEGTESIITDIDGTLTLSDEELFRQLGDSTYDPVENGSATELMNGWYDLNYRIIYLTARPNDFRAPTRSWLDDHGFPFAPVITAESLVFDESARTYKREFVNRVVDDLGWDLVAAYGNANSDIQAYEDAGIPKDVTFIIGEYAGSAGTVAIPDNDYAAHISEYVANVPASDQWTVTE